MIEGKINSRYEIVKKLGEGGNAIVYLAFDMIEENYVAIKTLKKEHVDERKIKYFQREAQAISLFSSENIIKFYDFGYDNVHGVHYIIQEYVDGMTLKDYLKVSSQLSVMEVIEIVTMIAKGIKHAHKKGVIHKDIKSQNILIDRNKLVKITDFGIADIIEDDTTKTQTLMGTPQYVAPETLNRGIINAQTDIYSIGILMYELLCGKTPFKGDKPTVVMMKQLNQPLPSIRMQRNDVSQFLENIVIKATAKKLENRYQNVDEMLRDLEKALYDNPVEKLTFKSDTFTSDEVDETIEFNSVLQKQHKNLVQKEKREKKALKIITALIIAILVILILSLVFVRNKNTIIMPDLTGSSYEELNETINLDMLGFSDSNIEILYETNPEIEEGIIISTDPEPGTEIDEDTKFTIVVSAGAEKFTVEDYVGQNIDDVKAILTENGIGYNIIEDESDLEKGTIISQGYESGSKIDYSDVIEIHISTGIPEISLDNFTGMSEETVDDYISLNSLNVTKVYVCHDYYDNGIIISQDVAAGSIVHPGDNITINISTGACPIDETVDNPEDILDQSNETVEDPIDETVEDPTDETVEDPTDETVEDPTDETVEDPNNIFDSIDDMTGTIDETTDATI